MLVLSLLWAPYGDGFTIFVGTLSAILALYLKQLWSSNNSSKKQASTVGPDIGTTDDNWWHFSIDYWLSRFTAIWGSLGVTSLRASDHYAEVLRALKDAVEWLEKASSDRVTSASFGLDAQTDESTEDIEDREDSD